VTVSMLSQMIWLMNIPVFLVGAKDEEIINEIASQIKLKLYTTCVETSLY